MSFTSFKVEGEGNIPYGLESTIYKIRVLFFGGAAGISTDIRSGITVNIYDSLDALVRTITLADPGSVSSFEVDWDSKDDSDEFVEPGFYRAEINWTENVTGAIVAYTMISVVGVGTISPEGSRTQVNQDYTGVGGKTENDGIVVINVRVRAMDTDDNIADETLSDANGNFILYLLAGTYTINFYKWNFERVDSVGVIVA